jgi:hypothetical protein
VYASVYSSDTVLPHQLCNPDYYATCQPPGSRNVAAFTAAAFYAMDDVPNCALCNEVEDCFAAQPVSRTTCFPHSKPNPTCTLCGSSGSGSPIDGASVGIGPVKYIVTIRPECTSNADCPGENNAYRNRRALPDIKTTHFAAGYYFERSVDLTVQGKQPGQPVVVEVCPFLTFVDATSVTIKNIDITCKSSATPETSPAIVFKGVTRTTITGASLFFAGYVKTGFLVLGGNFVQGVIPPTMAVNLDGSKFTNLGFSGFSAFRAPKELSLASYYGTISLSGLAPYTRILVQPYTLPSTLVYNTANGPRGGLCIVNLSAYTNIFGTDYEIAVDNPDAFGYPAIKETAERNDLLRFVAYFAVVITVVTLFANQDSLYYFYLLKKMKKE